MEKIDIETKRILGEAKQLQSLVNGEGWDIARKKLTDKIADLQNAFNIEDKDEHEMLTDLKARKLATAILFDWIRDIEGTAHGADDMKINKKSYIITK